MMRKTNEEVVPDQPLAKTLNDENLENKNSVTTPSKVSNETKTSPNITKAIPVTYQKKVNQATTTVVTLKSNFKAEFSSDNNLTQRSIVVASTAVINNKSTTTPITFQFRPPKDTTSFNVAQARNFFPLQ